MNANARTEKNIVPSSTTFEAFLQKLWGRGRGDLFGGNLAQKFRRKTRKNK